MDRVYAFTSIKTFESQMNRIIELSRMNRIFGCPRIFPRAVRFGMFPAMHSILDHSTAKSLNHQNP